ncbi:MAG: hypothetical protein IT318_14090 [Anaerolineales bacterium]|nr:hypothetical protein [Anaerolineales bacterium]
MLRPNRLACLLILLATACTGLPLPRLVFDTPTPGATAGPPPTPLPSTIVTFNVRVPANTPPGSAPAVALLDEVGGRRTTVILTDSGNNLWTGGTEAAAGSVLRYRYIRPLPNYVEELTPARQTVPYRLLYVTSDSPLVDDTVAAWTDTLFTGETGTLEGRVWNAATARGVMGVLVTGGGQVTVTGYDGSFVFRGLPPGPQRATVIAPDGSLRPTQQSVTVGPHQTAAIDLVSVDPNAVHLTFLVRPPPGADASAVLRLVGDVWQLGDSFVLGPNGSSVSAARAPAMVPLADGRWTVRVQLYEGTLLRYKYTLGDGVWNGEMDSSGNPRLRQLIVPPSDVLIDDTISAWRAPGAASVVFEALTPGSTPGSDNVSVQFRPGGSWHTPLPMWRVGTNDWRFVLYNPSDFSGSVFYRYCRNAACGTADDAQTAGPAASGRFFTPALFGQNLRDTITRWQWLDPAPGGSGVLPAIRPHPGFAAGFDLADSWLPDSQAVWASAFDAMRASGAGWVTFTRRAAVLPGAGGAPAFSDDPSLAPLPPDWNAIVSVAHNVGLRVSLHPVTCHYTPYGACDYWAGANFGGNFWNDWFTAYERYLLTQAELARQSGADQLTIGDFKLRPSFPGEPEAPGDAEGRWRGLIARVRSIYAGPLAFELLLGDSLWPSPPAFLDAVDVLRVSWWGALSGSNSATVPEMTAAAGNLLDSHVLPLQQRFGRPVIVSAAFLAADGAATQCLRQPDGQCYSFEAFEPGAPDVSAYGLDLQEQADAYSALLGAVNDRSWVGGLFSFGYHPMAILRDKSISVRGKPAETVLSAWWPVLQGR